jgi:hypothetical protein
VSGCLSGTQEALGQLAAEHADALSVAYDELGAQQAAAQAHAERAAAAAASKLLSVQEEAAAESQALSARVAELEHEQASRWNLGSCDDCVHSHPAPPVCLQHDGRMLPFNRSSEPFDGMLAVQHNVKLCFWAVPRPSRPEDLAQLADVRQQVREQEARAQAAEVALHSLRKEVPSVHWQAGSHALLLTRPALTCQTSRLMSGESHHMQVLLHADAEHGNIKSAGFGGARNVGQSLAAQSGIMAWMQGTPAASGSMAAARGRATTTKPAAPRPGLRTR